MSVVSRTPKFLTLVALLAMPASVTLAAQPQDAPLTGSVTDTSTEMTPGPDVKGTIVARTGEKVKVRAADGTDTIVFYNGETRIGASGLFGGGGKLGPNALLNGLPVTVKTLRSDAGLLASRITLKNKDLRVATMIRNGTEQGFAEQSAATEALRSRVADIGQYNVKATTNVNFDTGKFALTDQAKNDLCSAATQAQGMNNAVLLVVGYTDSTGSEELNQVLSEKRASRVVNYLQQACGWKPYRMLTPTGMAESDPAADNTTYSGKAQNRRVAVNVLVSKGLDGM